MKPLLVLWFALAFCGISNAQTSESTPRPVVVSARVKNGKIIYKLNGKIVENSVRNSLITNLENVLKTRGRETPVFIVVDVRAAIAQFGHIETALDKVDLPNRRFFVTNFTDDMMIEIHWDDKPVRIPHY
jgi:hypothetical protein